MTDSAVAWTQLTDEDLRRSLVASGLDPVLARLAVHDRHEIGVASAIDQRLTPTP